MTSNDKVGPSENVIKLNATEPVMDVHSMNKLFPKIDNLEHSPLKVLMNIFQRLDYMDLYNLAEKSVRFESIAKIVMKERYEHEDFLVDESKHKHKTYIDFFERFGNEIKAIKVQNVKKANKHSDWITSLLDKTKNLEKLTIEKFTIDFDDEKIFEHVNAKITHLILSDCDCKFGAITLYKFFNLKRLEIRNWPIIRNDGLTQMIRYNPGLEGLILSDRFEKHGRTLMGTVYKFDRMMEYIGTYLKELKEFEYTPRSKELIFMDDIVQPSHDVIEKFIDSLKHLESLGLSSNVELYTNFNELLRRLSSECKKIKHLKLYDIDGSDPELFDIIRSFKNIESLALAFTEIGDEIESLVEHLPFLRELDIAFNEDIDWSFILILLNKCTTLEKLVVTGDPDDEIEWFGTNEFYTEFIESMQNPKLKMEVKFRGQSVGSISKDEVIWRNKLVHWAGYDPHLNLSNINVLDLAKEPSSVDANAEQPSPFDVILGYLDLKSLCSLSQTSKKCLQLVENHVKQHSKQEKVFTITNELGSSYDGLEMFAECVTNLRVDIFNSYYGELQELLEKFQNLTKLYIYTEVGASPLEFIVPQLRHLIFDGSNFKYYSQLRELSVVCPDLETFELIQPAVGRFDAEEEERLEFRNLKKFTLKYYEEIKEQAKNLRIIFEDTNTEVYLKI